MNRKNSQIEDGALVVGGVRFLIDAEDIPLVSSYRWVLYNNARGHVYAQANQPNRKRLKAFSAIRLHRLLLGLQPGDGRMADHINGDTTDNRRANLRVSSHKQNNQNRSARGCSAQGNKWVAKCRGKYLGMFDSEAEARAAYLIAAKEAYGEFHRKQEG